MNLSRRGLFGGVGAFLAAPAIVRAASLMPVSVIKAEPLWLLAPEGIFEITGTTAITSMMQMPLDEFHQRILEPAMAKLQEAIEQDAAILRRIS